MIFKRTSKKKEYQSWHGYLLLAVLIVAIILGIFQKFGEPVDQTTEPAGENQVIDPPAENQPVELPIEINQPRCEASGGQWEDCGSACRGSDEPCITVCATYCYCEADNECPAGYTCTNYIDNIGICESL